MTHLSERLAQLKSENRAAFIGYLPAGFPTVEKSKAAIEVLVKNGVDIVEIGFPYSDPIMDGPIIQEAADIALANGTGASEVLEILGFTTNLKVPAVVMTYWNPIEQYGISKFADAIKSANGSGVITPDLSLEESISLYDEKVALTKQLMMDKNHDYGEAWRDMRVSSLTDLILQKLLRVKQIEDHQGKTLVSEGIVANYQDMLNYAVFALIHLEQS